MADKVKYSINVSPLEEAPVDDGTGPFVLSTNIKRNLGASGSFELAGSGWNAMLAANGFDAGLQTYLVVDNTNGNTVVGAAAQEVIWIKNTGKKLSTATHGGTATTSDGTTANDIKVYYSATLLTVLSPGEGILFKDHDGALAGQNFKVESSGTDKVLVERLAI